MKSYRQVLTSYPANKQIAAQAQYQLVLCMLQKGDRPAATHELDLLSRNFPDQQDFINKARKLIPGASTVLAAPWADGEASQLNIKRDGAFTGEYLYYSATPWGNTIQDMVRNETRDARVVAGLQTIYLASKLVTKTSSRTIETKVDRDSMRRMETTSLQSDDILGDQSAVPFAGPAIDAEPLVFRMRVLPLAVGYKTTLSTLPFLIGHGVARPVELAVTAVEPVQTVAGKFNCYKVSFASLGQTFWIGVDGARPLVKFQSGNVEAELVKVWGPSVFDDALAFLKTAGWSVMDVAVNRSISYGEDNIEGGSAHASSPQDGPFGKFGTSIRMRRIYTPPAEMDQAAERSCSDRAKDLKGQIRPQSLQPRTVGGLQSASCTIDYASGENKNSDFYIFVRTESLILRFDPQQGTATFRWIFEPILDTIKLPK